jgi:hypothetical protein
MLAKLWPQKGPEWVMCIRQHAMDKQSTTDERAAARSAESGVGAQAPPTETPGEERAAGNADVKERFFVGDIVRIEGSVGKLYQGEEAQVDKITKKTMVVVLTTGKHTGKQDREATAVRPRAGQHASFVYEAWAHGRASASSGCARARHGRGGASEDHRGKGTRIVR